MLTKTLNTRNFTFSQISIYRNSIQNHHPHVAPVKSVSRITAVQYFDLPPPSTYCHSLYSATNCGEKRLALHRCLTLDGGYCYHVSLTFDTTQGHKVIEFVHLLMYSCNAHAHGDKCNSLWPLTNIIFSTQLSEVRKLRFLSPEAPARRV